ncbi:hypothetical protein APHAL10511_000524 [Amanita phalloides]|nr:hypothetical protein APHAL10511_000524 [Amanita phalloides]
MPNSTDTASPTAPIPTVKERVFAFSRTIWQAAGQKFTAVSQNAPLPAILAKSYAEPFVRLAEGVVDDRTSQLSKIVEEYAIQKNKSPKDQDRMNRTTIKLFHKLVWDQDYSTSDKASYYRCVKSSATDKVDTSAERIYDDLLKTSRAQFHPQGISGLAYAFAAILSLSLHREVSPQSDLKSNGTSPYFDLSPLYGVNETESSTIRMKDGHGMLWPDSFCEDRIAMFPDAVAALLILWNRYHNHVAKQLLLHNEHGEWSDPSELTFDQCSTQDDQIFNVARSITCIHFINVVKEDFLKGLLGLPSICPSPQLDILYDVRGRADVKTGYLSSLESYLLYSFTSLAPPSFTPKMQDGVPRTNGTFVDFDMRRRNFMGVRRNKNDYFDDNDLAKLLFNATETKAGSPGGKAVPYWAREQEIRKIQQARQANVCTLNEFRKRLGLKPLVSFEEWNSDLAKAARDLYDDIDKLELYPGLVGERSMGGSGFGFGYTMSWGLIADIVTRLRHDPVITTKFTEHALTKWGYKDSLSSFDDTRGCFGAMLPKLMQRTLARNYTYNNVYCLFPFSVPEESKVRFEKGATEEKGKTRFEEDLIKENKKYNFDRPRPSKTKMLRSLKAISEVFNDPKTFPSPYKQNLIELTGGYGHMLGFDDLALHDRDLMLTLFSLLPDKGAVRRIGADFAHKAQRNLEERSIKSGDRATIDVVKDLIDATCTRWVCETIYSFQFEDDDMRGLSESKQKEARERSRTKETEERENFDFYYAYVFRNTEPEFGWNVREKALNASKHLSKHLKKHLPGDTEPSDAHFFVYTLKFVRWFTHFVSQLLEEYSTHGKKLPQYSALTFLDRMMKAAHIRPLKRLMEIEHLPYLKKRYEEEARKELEAEQSRTLVERMRMEGIIKGLISLVGDGQLTDADIEDNARHKLEEQRVVANVIGLAMVISVHFSKVCAQAINFYLDDKYAKEREALVKLCKDDKSSNEEIMAYIREAQRIGQHFGLWRDVTLSPGQTRVIKQGFGYPDVTIEAGDRVFADFTSAHNDPNQIPEPEKVKIDRKVNSLLGLGVHKCPAGSFIDQTMSEIFRVIFKQEGLKRSNKDGRLNFTTLHPNPAPWHSEVFLDDDGGFSHYPKKLMLEFDSSKLKTHDWEVKKDERAERLRKIIDRGCTALVIVLVLCLFMYLFASFSLPSLPARAPGSGQTKTECGQPLTTIEDWHVKAFHPKWFGLFGEPAPIMYKTPRKRKAHQISVIDIDKRDIEIRMWVDNEDRGHRTVDLDPTVDCGDNISQCIAQGFGAALIVVPPGRHTVKAEIKQHNGTKFNWGKERKRRVMWMVQECP